MKIPRLLLFHAALVSAGWGIVAALEPRPVTAEVIVATKTSARDERARREGEEILRQMEAALPAPEAPEPVSPEEGPYEERLRKFATLNHSWPPDVPIDRRIAVALAKSEISGIISGEDGPDLSYSFFHRRMEASEILALLSRQFPEHVRDHVLLEVIFYHLASFDPARAVDLLAPLSSTERNDFSLSLIYSAAYGGHPDIWREVTVLNAASTNPGWVGRREAFWASAVDRHLEAFGDSYLPWVLDLPTGADREAAVSATASMLKEIDAAAAEGFLKSAKASASGIR